MDKVLILIRGLPGSGKTTLAKTLAEGKLGSYPICSEDDYYKDENGVYKWSKEKELEAKQLCIADTIKFISFGFTKLFVTNVFLTQKDLEPYLNLAKKYNYRCHVLIAQNTHGNQSVHNVKLEDFEEMQRNFEILL